MLAEIHINSHILEIAVSRSSTQFHGFIASKGRIQCSKLQKQASYSELSINGSTQGLRQLFSLLLIKASLLKLANEFMGAKSDDRQD